MRRFQICLQFFNKAIVFPVNFGALFLCVWEQKFAKSSEIGYWLLGADSLGDLVVNIFTLHRGLYQASLDSSGDVSHLGLLDAMLLHGVYASVLQERYNWSKPDTVKLGVSLSFCLTLDLLCWIIGIDGCETIGAVCGGHILAFQDIFQLL